MYMYSPLLLLYVLYMYMYLYIISRPKDMIGAQVETHYINYIIRRLLVGVFGAK